MNQECQQRNQRNYIALHVEQESTKTSMILMMKLDPRFVSCAERYSQKEWDYRLFINTRYRTMTTLTEEEVFRSGNSRTEKEYIVELVTENPGISVFNQFLLTALGAVNKEKKVVGRLRRGVMRYYTPTYIEKCNL